MKKKVNGTYQARLDTIIYDQVEGIHCNESKTTLPVTNNIIIHIVMVLILMAGCIVNILDVKGAFLHGEFDEGKKKIYMEVPEAFEGIFRSGVLLMLIKTIYGLKCSKGVLERYFESICCDVIQKNQCRPTHVFQV